NDPKDLYVFASDINNSGQVVLSFKPHVPGLRADEDIHRGFLIDGRRVIELDPAARPEPIAINDAGQVAGIASLERVFAEGTPAPYGWPSTKFYDQVGFRTRPNQPLELARDDI